MRCKTTTGTSIDLSECLCHSCTHRIAAKNYGLCHCFAMLETSLAGGYFFVPPNPHSLPFNEPNEYPCCHSWALDALPSYVACQLSVLCATKFPSIAAYLGLLEVSSLQNLCHAFVLVRCPKFILQSSLACGIVRILSSVPKSEIYISDSSEQFSRVTSLPTTAETPLLVGDKNLEAADHLSKRDRTVALPLFH